MVKIFFPRYVLEGGRDMEFHAFSQIVKTFLDEVPAESRPSPSSRRIQFLQAGSVGCVGVLASWFVRALTRCVGAGSEGLEWPHFEETAFSDADLATLRSECEAGERRFRELSVRTLEGLFGRDVSPDASTEPPVPAAPAAGKASGRRPGTPKPARHRVRTA